MNRLVLALLVFLILGALFIVSNENLHLSDSEEFDSFGRLYFAWVSGLISNIGDIAGNVVLENWIPDSDLNVSNMTR